MKIGFVSLGCSKNLVDTEHMIGLLQKAGFEITADESEAEVIIINTCGFIESAKQEAIDMILEMANYKKEGALKKLIVTGCLAQRYKDEIKKELPEVDCAVGTGHYHDIVETVNKVLLGESVFLNDGEEEAPLEIGERVITTSPSSVYLKIAEGCDNHCTYCAIPKIRGRFRSRKIEDIVLEAKKLAKDGAKELILVAQDTARYGIDLYGEPKLSKLLKELCRIDEIKWVRVHYLYPELITDELIEVFSQNEKLLNYFDIPIQHASDSVLKRMGRKSTCEETKAVIKKLRKRLSGVVIRTSIIVGFPGETDEDFASLMDFIEEMKFEKMGAFMFSAEEGTPAEKLSGQISDKVKEERYEALMERQEEISEELLKNFIGKELTVICEGYDMGNKLYYGRSYMDSPDIDAKVFFATDSEEKIGGFSKVRIVDSIDYDLIGVRI